MAEPAVEKEGVVRLVLMRVPLPTGLPMVAYGKATLAPVKGAKNPAGVVVTNYHTVPGYSLFETFVQPVGGVEPEAVLKSCRAR